MNANTPTVALVTGASRGLGRETCGQLRERGMRVLATSRGDASEPLDVTNDASVRALVERLRARGERIDVLVNNAGVYDGLGRENVLEVNLFGALRVTDAVLPLMSDGGAVVMVSSGMGELATASTSLRKRLLDDALTRDQLLALVADERAGWPSMPYRISKMALNALTRILARELRPRRMRVNAVCPGWVRTDMGGAGASRDVATGAASIVWAATLRDDDATTGGFFRDGKRIAW